MMEPFLVSTAVVALAEIGDKTQLLALLLAIRFRRPWIIAAGILVATLLNHAAASGLGTWISAWVGPQILRWLLALSFFAMAVWTLIPDRIDETPADSARWGIFGTTVIAFFLAEMGDKTQIATIALAAQYAAFFAVVAGTTLGMLIANVPVVFLGERITRRIPLHAIRWVAAALFALLGGLLLIDSLGLQLAP